MERFIPSTVELLNSKWDALYILYKDEDIVSNNKNITPGTLTKWCTINYFNCWNFFYS